MTNFQVYRKTLPFSFIIFLVSLLSIAQLVGFCVAGFFIGNNGEEYRAFVGLGIGFVIGILVAIAIDYLVLNRIKAGQIAMMTKGVADDKLPDHVVKEGFSEVRGRFAKITAFFVVTNLIKGMFRQIGRALNGVGRMVGGQAGDTVTSVIDSAVQILLGYLCDCCLGWVMYRKDQGVTKSACEGAVIFFKNGKTLFRNIGRIFGMGILSFVVVGGALFAGSYLIFAQFPTIFAELSTAIQNLHIEDLPTWVYDTRNLTMVICAIGSIVLWSTIHSVVGRPFILVGVLRNFMAAGKANIPTEEDFKVLDSKSSKFAKLRQKNI